MKMRYRTRGTFRLLMEGVLVTGRTTVNPVPDFWDGVNQRNIYSTVRESFSTIIVPTKHSDAPIASNFSLEAKATYRALNVAQRQAIHTGTYGARIIHALQSFTLDEPSYDGKVAAYSSTYHSGILKIYANHLCAPTTVGGSPSYHITQLDGFDLTGSPAKFREDVSSLRNIRDLASCDGTVSSKLQTPELYTCMKLAALNCRTTLIWYTNQGRKTRKPRVTPRI